MIRYILKRLGYFVLVFLIVSALLFVVYRNIPGDPVVLMMEGSINNLTAEQYQTLYDQTAERLGMHLPLPVQYVYWLKDLLTGNFGYSTQYMRPVADVIGAPMMNTIILNIGQLILVFAIAFPLGIKIAVNRNGFLDRAVQGVSIVGYSMPTMVVAIVFIYLFAIKLKIFPISGMNSPGFVGGAVATSLDRFWHMLLPLIVMTFVSLGGIIRYVRAAMIDALSMDCVRTARAKGLSEKVVIYSHAFRNALLPLITVITYWFVGIFSGSIVTESIFLYNGMGKMMISGLNQLDYSVVMAMQMFYVVLALVGNLVMDLLYAVVDPRVKLS